MGQHRLRMVIGAAVVLAASVACGDGDGATVTPAAVVATPSAAATSTVAASATSAVSAGTRPDTAAPSATTAPVSTSAPAVQPTVAPPPPTTAPPPPPPPPPPAEQSLTVVAKDVTFSPSPLTARAGGVLHLTLDNQDTGVEHDIVLYDASGAVAGATDPAMGPVRQTLTLTLGAPGRYAFKCSVHPQTMRGVLAVQ